jgi:hypothetical protein
MTCKPVPALILLLGALPGAAQLNNAGAATRDKCKEYLNTPLPAEAQQAKAPTKWPECNSPNSYSGIGTKVDYAAARKCAWQERLAQQADIEPRYTVTSVFGGSAMLAVLYANGEGVPRSYDLALRFVCEAEGAPAEISIRIDDIESRRAKQTPQPRFDFCDDITSGFMEGFCAAFSSEIDNQKRNSDLRDLSNRMTDPQREAFQNLIKAEQAYARAHGSGEIDISGTARAMYEIDAEDTLRDDFLAALQLFEKRSGLPGGGSAEYREADQQLNIAYQKSISDAQAHKSDYGSIQPEGIRNAERAWIRYRDAFVAYALLRYPSVPKEAWLTLLTHDRTAILDGSFCDMDDVDGHCARKGDTWKPSPLP